MAKYRITYKDGRKQEVQAESYGIYGGRYVFSASGREVLSIAADAVESVALADVPEAKRAPARARAF